MLSHLGYFTISERHINRTKPKMSWAAYITNMLDQSKDEQGCRHGDKGCILDKTGGSSWTPATEGAFCMNVQATEMKTLAGCINTSDFSNLLASGLHLEGVKYNVLRASAEDGVYAKKKENGSIWIKWSNKAIVVCHVTEDGQAGKVCDAVHKIAEYLKNVGY